MTSKKEIKDEIKMTRFPTIAHMRVYNALEQPVPVMIELVKRTGLCYTQVRKVVSELWALDYVKLDLGERRSHLAIARSSKTFDPLRIVWSANRRKIYKSLKRQ